MMVTAFGEASAGDDWPVAPPLASSPPPPQPDNAKMKTRATPNILRLNRVLLFFVDLIISARPYVNNRVRTKAERKSKAGLTLSYALGYQRKILFFGNPAALGLRPLGR